MILSKSSTLTNVVLTDHKFQTYPVWSGKVCFWFRRMWPDEPAGHVADESLSFSGSNQAREGRLVDALAARGDEGRDTLR